MLRKILGQWPAATARSTASIKTWPWRFPRAGSMQSRRHASYRSFQNVPTSQTWLRTYQRPLAIVFGAGVIIYVTNLHEVPESGRRRFIIVPEWVEDRVGESSYKQIMAQYRGQVLPSNHPQARKVQEVMQRLIKVSGLDPQRHVDWQIHVIAGDEPPNAFVLPGGKVFVFQSILPITQNDDGLATVLAHELAHQVCRHTAESMSWSPIYIALSAVLYGITGTVNLDALLLNTVLKLPASRAMESEADYVGVLMMARACFDPAAAVGLWQRMRQAEQAQGVRVPELLSTHPASERRIRDIQKEVPKAQHVRSEQCADASGFFQAFQR